MSEFIPYTLSQLGLAVSSPERALLCRPCKIALRVDVNAICDHLTDRHNADARVRHHVVQLLQRVELTDISRLQPRSDTSLEDENLRTFHGTSCLQCSHRTSSAQTHWRHLSAQHDTRKEHAIQGVHFRSVLLQAWTHGGPTGRHPWVITPNPSPRLRSQQESERIEMTTGQAATRRGRKRKGRDSERRQETHTAAPLPDFLQNLHEDERRQHKAPAGIANIPENALADQALTSPWMQRTQWHRIFGRARRGVIVKLTDTPSQSSCRNGLLLGEIGGNSIRSCAANESRLVRVTEALHQMFDRCEQTVNHTARPILCWLWSRSPDQPSKLPFQLVGHKSTRQKYRRAWLRIILACLRSVSLDDGPGSIQLEIRL